MRINKYIALATGKSRRVIDTLIQNGSVQVNGHVATIGQDVTDTDKVTIDGKLAELKQVTTIVLNKPIGYVCSRDGQGSKTVYDLLPKEYHHLKPVGRLDKDSSGLLLLTNDGDLAHKLTHPSFEKGKKYIVGLRPALTKNDQQRIEKGVALEDGLSKLHLQPKGDEWQVMMHEGRNRQIRRTFSALGYTVTKLHRVEFGAHKLNSLAKGAYREIS